MTIEEIERELAQLAPVKRSLLAEHEQLANRLRDTRRKLIRIGVKPPPWPNDVASA